MTQLGCVYEIKLHLPIKPASLARDEILSRSNPSACRWFRYTSDWGFFPWVEKVLQPFSFDMLRTDPQGNSQGKKTRNCCHWYFGGCDCPGAWRDKAGGDEDLVVKVASFAHRRWGRHRSHPRCILSFPTSDPYLASLLNIILTSLMQNDILTDNSDASYCAPMWTRVL